MRLIAILNSTLDFKSDVFEKCSSVKRNSIDTAPMLEITVRPRKGSKPICSGCKQKHPGYDTLALRHFEHIPLWGLLVFFLYAPRRVQCPQCGVKVEEIPWANGKSPLTTSYCWFLAGCAKRLSWQEVADSFKTTWHHVFTACQMAVEWGRGQLKLDNIDSIGIDEVLWHRGKKFLTVVYQIDPHCKRLLWIGKGRSRKTLAAFFKWFGTERTANLRFVCSDIWQAYIKEVKEKVQGVLHVLDRFHIVSLIHKAIDQVRAQEARIEKVTGQREKLYGFSGRRGGGDTGSG
jgi:transposase